MIYVSTNMYKPLSFMKVTKIVDEFNGEVGIEFFPMFHDANYEALIDENLEKLKKYKFTFHGPYAKTEHSAEKGSDLYNETIRQFKQMLKFSEPLNPSYIVYHYNNCKINDRGKMIENANENLDELHTMTDIELLIENVGVDFAGNKLFNEEEFINIFSNRKERALIDLGHLNANSWNMENVIKSLKDKIISYHLHSNDGIHDSHNRIFENTPDMEEFIKLYKKYTPTADLVIEYSSLYEDKEDLVIEDIKKLKKSLEEDPVA